jgi:uncharacterized membrane protein YgcG
MFHALDGPHPKRGKKMQIKTILISTSFALMATTALSQSSKEDIIEQLTEQGFKRIEISRTLFGNTRFEATGPGIERQIVLGKDGTVVRDRSETDDEYDDNDQDEDDNDDNENDDSESDDSESDDGGNDDSESDDSESDSDRGGDDGGNDDSESDDSESDSDRGGDSEGGDSDGGDSDGGGDSEGGDSDGDD